MIDWTFEERLHERIDARRLIEQRLTPRQRHIVRRTYRYGETLGEIAKQDGVTTARVWQILKTSLSRLRHVPEQAVVVRPGRHDLRGTPPPGFDWEEFRRHHAQLIRRREAEAATVFEDARRELDNLLESEAPKPAPAYVYKPKSEPTLWYDPAPLKPVLKPWQAPIWDPQPLEPAAPQKWPGNVEPWFDLARMPTAQDLAQLAFYAINYFSAICSPLPEASSAKTGTGVRIECPRTADAVATYLQRAAREIPPDVRFLRSALPVPDGVLGASVGSRWVAMRVCSMKSGQWVSIEIGWE